MTDLKVGDAETLDKICSSRSLPRFHARLLGCLFRRDWMWAERH